MADIITANVLKQMAEIVDNDAEFAPLTEDDYRKIKNLETDIIKDGSDPNVKQYLLKLIQMEADNEQNEKSPETKLAQQTPLPWPIHSNTTTKKGVTWQAPQMPPTPKEDMLPSGPLPQPPPMYEDTPGHHHISLTAEAQGDWQGGKRSKDVMKTPCEDSADATATTATPQPKRSKKESHEGDPDTEM